MRAMKDSGIPWIGEIPKDWKVMKLRNLGKFSASGIDKKVVEDEPLVRIINYVDIYKNTNKELWEQNYMVVSAPAEKCQEHQVNVGDMFFTPSSETIEDIGVSAVVMEELANTAFSYHIIRFQPTTDIDFNFRKYITNNTACLNYFSSCATGSIRKTISRDVFKECIVLLPPLAEQQRIAEFLDRKCAEVDEMIALQEQIIEELKAYKQSVITEAVTKGLNPDVPMRDSGIEWIGEIPEHWDIVTPKALFSQRKEKAKEGQKQLTSSQQYGILYQDEYSEITGNKVVVVMKDFDILKQVQAGDFVISMRSFQGGLEYSTKTGSISSAYVMLIPNLDYVYPRFYRWLFKSICYINALQSTSNMVRDGQAMRFSNFAQVPLYQVPLKEQESIADYLDEKCADIDKLIQTKQEKIESLKEYKKSIIYEYVTGKREITE